VSRLAAVRGAVELRKNSARARAASETNAGTINPRPKNMLQLLDMLFGLFKYDMNL
jgi:hypothetical protein